MGNLTRDPELRYIPSGTAVASFTIAANRYYKSTTGERKEETSFVRIVVWGRRAEVCGEFLSKGSPVFVEGRLRSRNWEGNDGQKRSTIEVIANNVQFLKPGKGQSAGGAMPEGDFQRDTQVPDDAAIAGDAKSKASAGEEIPF